MSPAPSDIRAQIETLATERDEARRIAADTAKANAVLRGELSKMTNERDTAKATVRRLRSTLEETP